MIYYGCMKTIEQRINIIIGQLEGIKKMSKKKTDSCFSVITQLKAIRSATSSLMETVLKEEFKDCFLRNNKKKAADLEKILAEIIKK